MLSGVGQCVASGPEESQRGSSGHSPPSTSYWTLPPAALSTPAPSSEAPPQPCVAPEHWRCGCCEWRRSVGVKYTRFWRKKNVNYLINNFYTDYINQLGEMKNIIKISFTSSFLLL